jgi:hypothetical protein
MRSQLRGSSAIFVLRGARSSANERRDYIVPAAPASIAAEFFQAPLDFAGSTDCIRADRLASAISRALTVADSKAG